MVDSASKKTANSSAAKKPAGDAAKAKKAKPPKLEDKPFLEFMQQHYLPAATDALKQEGLDDIELNFEKRRLDVLGMDSADECWQVLGQWAKGSRQFSIGFLQEDIGSQKVFTCSSSGSKPSTLEQFMGDERRVTLGLMVMYTVQRLNGQKWLTGN